MSRRRRFGLLLQAPVQQRDDARRRCRRHRAPVGLALENRRRSCQRSFHRRKAGEPVSISYSTQPNAQISVRLSTGSTARLLGAHVGDGSENRRRRASLEPVLPPRRRAIRSVVTIGCRLGEPEVQHLRRMPVRRQPCTFAGFRSRCTIPLPCAASSAFGDLAWRSRAASAVMRRPLLRDPVRERRSLDQFQDQRANPLPRLRDVILDAVDRADVRVVQGWRACAPPARSATAARGHA